MKPILILNLKTYQTGKSALKIAKAAQKIDKDIIIGVQAADIRLIAEKTKLKVYAEHVDPVKPGRKTGYIVPKDVKAAGAAGTFLNHSEHKISFAKLKETVKICKKIKLKLAIFAKNLTEAKKIERLKPDYLIIEPPELIAGKLSITDAKPRLIKKVAKGLKSRFIVGAGINKYEDIVTSVKLGASGVAFASIITKAKNPKKALKKLIKG